MAAHAELSAPAGRGGKAEFYYLKAQELIATGKSAKSAFKMLADANDVSVANIKAGYARYAKANGHPTTPGGGARSRSTSSAATTRRATASVPRDLEPILDAIRKDRASLNSNIDALIRWAQAQEAKVATAVDDAREAALRQIREAAASIR